MYMHGYGYSIDGKYKYGYKSKNRCYGCMRRNPKFNDCLTWSVFKIDYLGFHEVQRHYKLKEE